VQENICGRKIRVHERDQVGGHEKGRAIRGSRSEKKDPNKRTLGRLRMESRKDIGGRLLNR